MKIRKSISYAYPTSTRAHELGHAKTGCYYVGQSILREDGTWSPDCVWPGTEGDATPDKNAQYLRDLFNEIDAEVSPYSMKY